MRYIKKAFLFAFVFVLAASLTSCSIKYRHQVEKPGAKANYTYGMGGYVRYDGYGQVAGDMEVAVAEFEKKGSPVKIQLVGVIHIGDKEYYEQLQKVLDASDLVLWEGVGMKGAKKKKRISKKPVKGMYWAMAQMLGLSTQKNCIDYNRKHWKRCDVTISRREAQDLNVANLQKVLKAFQALVPMKQQISKVVPTRQFEDYIKHNNAMTMVRSKQQAQFKMMAKQAEMYLRQIRALKSQYPGNALLEKLEKQLEQIKTSMEKMSTFIIKDRNKFVMKQLGKELEALKNQKKPYTISIFYGAGHNPDFEKRLNKIGYKRTGRKWYKAWAMNTRR